MSDTQRWAELMGGLEAPKRQTSAPIGETIDLQGEELARLRQRVEELEHQVQMLRRQPVLPYPTYVEQTSPHRTGMHPGCVQCIGTVCGNAACPSRVVIC